VPAEDVEEEAEAAASTLDSEFGRTTDPVRMYMREMGSVELLTREGEIEIAKRIEEGLKHMILAISACPMTVTQILDLADKIGKDELKIDDVVDGLLDFNEQLSQIEDEREEIEEEEDEADPGVVESENLERLKVAALERFGTIRKLFTRMLGEGEVFLSDLVQFLLVHFLKIEHHVSGSASRTNDLIQFYLQSFRVPVLGVLNKKNHEERNDGCTGVDHQLPGIAIPKEWSCQCPSDNYCAREKEGPRMAHRNRTIFCNSRKHGLQTLSLIYRFHYHDSPSFKLFHSMENCVRTLERVLKDPHDAANVILQALCESP